jgi:hypothetical protein
MNADNPTFSKGYQSIPVNWKINSTRKIEYFKLLSKICGFNKEEYRIVQGNKIGK